MASYPHFRNGKNHQALIRWFTLIPELKDLCADYCDKDLDNWMPEGARIFWNEVYDSFESALYDCMNDLKEEILDEVKLTQEETRTILKQAGLKPGDQLWSISDLVEFFKLPEHLVLKIVDYPMFPRSLTLSVNGDNGKETHQRWFSRDVVSYMSRLQFPPPMSVGLSQRNKSKRDDSSDLWSDETN